MANVAIQHLTKVFEQSKNRRLIAINDLNLSVESGELLVLVGPSGCGKTTTLRLIAGLETPTAGSVSIDGRDVTQLPPKERNVAMVFQQPALYPHMTAYQNLAFPLILRKTQRSEIAARVNEVAGVLEINDCLQRTPRELSGGQKQRVALGRALIRRPALMLLDEPLSNLDLHLRAEMRMVISRVNRSTGCTMIYVTHDQSEALMLGKRLAVMKEGIIQQIGKPLDVYRHPENLFVAGFIGWPAMNLVRGTVKKKAEGSWFEQQVGEVASTSISFEIDGVLFPNAEKLAGKEVILGIRPENLGSKLPAGGPTFDGTVEAIEPTGAETYLRLRNGDFAVVVRTENPEGVSINQKRSIGFDLRFAHFFDAKTGENLLMK